MRLPQSNQVLSDAVRKLLAGETIARIELAKRMGVADGTLGRIKYGKANPTLDVVDQIAHYYRIPAWKLLQPPGVAEESADYGSPHLGQLIDAVKKLAPEKQDALLQLLSG